MSMYKTLEMMRASDFGVDEDKYSDLVRSGRDGDRRFGGVIWGFVALNVILIATVQAVVLPGILVLLGAHRLTHLRAARLGRELGISRRHVKQVHMALRAAH